MANGKRVAGVSVDMTLELAQFKASCREAETVTKQMTAQMREEMEHSRESVRLLSEELHLGIPRGLQGIISKLPGVTTAMNAAFDAVVVFALINTIVEVTKKVIEFAKKTEEAAEKHATAWHSFNDSTRTANDSLDLTLIKLENATAKLEHKPQNRMAEAIQEAIVKADELGEKLSADAALISKNIADEQVGVLGWLKGQDNSWAAQHARQMQTDLEEVDLGPDVVQDMSKQYRSKRITDTAADDAQKHLDEVKKQQANTPAHGMGEGAHAYQPDIDATTDLIHAARAMSSFVVKTDSVANATAAEAVAQTKADTAKDAKEAAEKAKRAAEEWLKGLEASFKANDRPAPGSITGEKSLAEWNSGRNSRETDFLNGVAGRDKLNQPELSALLTKRSELGAGANEAALTQHAKEYDEATATLTAIMNQDIEADKKLLNAKEKYAAEVEKSAVAAASNLAKSQISAAHLGLTEHTISPHAAALIEQAAHVTEFAAKLLAAHAELTTLQKDQKGLTAGTPEYIENATKQLGVNGQIAGLASEAGDTAREDSARAFDTSFKGQVDKTFNDIIADSQDWGKQFRETVEGALTDVNAAILHILTDKPQAGEHPFRAAGKQIFSGVAKTGLQDAEGFLIHGTVGKLGTKNNPVYTIDLSKAGSEGQATGQRLSGDAVGGAAGSFLKWANQSDFMGQLFGGKVFGKGGILDSPSATPTSKLPNEATWPQTMNSIVQMGASAATMAAKGMKGGSNSNGSGPVADWGSADAGSNWTMPDSNAGGGVLSAGDWSWVGEGGPELMRAGSSSRIYSNRDSMAMTSGHATHYHSYTIDARGATDPAAINMAVQRGIRQAAPHIVAATNSSQKDLGRRTPRGH